jgi:hypothetical protein
MTVRQLHHILVALIGISLLTSSIVMANPFHTGFFQKRMTLTDYADTTNLVALWRLDENSLTNGSTVYDYFGKHNGTLVVSSGSANYLTTGKKFRAVSLNPASPNTSINVSGSTDFVKNSTSAFTIMFWYNRRGSHTNNCLISFAYNASNDSWCPATGTDNSSMAFWDGTNDIIASVGSITSGTWYHFAVVVNGSSVKMYWNGSLVKSTTGSTTSYTNKNVYFGWDSEDGVYVPAYLDEVSYWTRALSAAEILDIYNKQN